MQICSPFHLKFHRCWALPITFQPHQLPVLSSMSPQFSKITCSAQTLLLWFRTENGPRKEARMQGFIAHVPFLSLQQHSTVLNTVVLYRFPSFLAVYDVREGGYHWGFQCGHWLKRSQVVWKRCKSAVCVQVTLLDSLKFFMDITFFKHNHVRNKNIK